VTIGNRIKLLWRRFSPLEEKLLAAVRRGLPPAALSTFDAQVAAINHVQRLSHWTEIDFYHLKGGKSDWTSVPPFPNTGEFDLAEIRFTVGGKRFKATLSSIKGHIFDFRIQPSPSSIGFMDWDDEPVVRMLADPLSAIASKQSAPVPERWLDFLKSHDSVITNGWTLFDADTARFVSLECGEFLVLAEREGPEFILHRVEPAASSPFFFEAHDATPEPINDILHFFQSVHR
jgi:hypothetical protein